MRAFLVSGQVTYFGHNPMCTAQDFVGAKVRFQEVVRGYQFETTLPCSSGSTPLTFSMVLFPGTYRVSVWTVNASNITDYQQLAEVTVAGNVSGLLLDVRAVQVSGAVTINGSPPVSAGCGFFDDTRVFVRFDEATRGYHTQVAIPCSATTTPALFSAALYPGTYRVSVGGGTTNMPQEFFTTHAALPITSTVTGLALNVPTVSVSGTITVNGQVPTAQGCATNDADEGVKLVDTTTREVFFLPAPCRTTPVPMDFDGTVFPGTYDVLVNTKEPTSSESYGHSYLERRAFTIGTPITGLALDAKVVSVSGSLTLNGAAVSTPCSGGSSPTVTWKNAESGASFALPVSCSSSQFSGSVYAGTYDVRVRGLGNTGGLPTKPFLARTNLAVAAPLPSQTLDVRTLSLAGVVLHNGQQPSSSCGGTSGTQAILHLVDPSRGYQFDHNVPCNGGAPLTFAMSNVYPGTYDVSVEGKLAALPAVAYPARSGLALQSSQTGLTLDVPTRSVSGVITLNGTQPTSNCLTGGQARAKVILSHADGGWSHTLFADCSGAVTPVTFSGQVFPGAYSLRVQGVESNLPAQPFIAARQLDVP